MPRTSERYSEQEPVGTINDTNTKFASRCDTPFKGRFERLSLRSKFFFLSFFTGKRLTLDPNDSICDQTLPFFSFFTGKRLTLDPNDSICDQTLPFFSFFTGTPTPMPELWIGPHQLNTLRDNNAPIGPHLPHSKTNKTRRKSTNSNQHDKTDTTNHC
jgi:hypothetical protein